jgi:hypothetical protein
VETTFTIDDAKPNADAAKPPRFKVRARNIGIPAIWFEGSTQDIFDKLDGPFAS